jgi:penicillin-binding protein 1A
MSTAPEFGPDARHEWLFVGSSGAARFAHAMFRLGRHTRHLIETTRELLERLRTSAARARLRASTARAIHHASVAARAAGALARSVQEHGFADRGTPMPAQRREFARPTPSSGSWRRGFAHATRRLTLLLVVFVGLPLAYLAYCLVTLPLNGGLVVEPTPSAVLVEADGGGVFATRGTFKGDKLAPDDIPEILARAVVAIEDRNFYQHRGLYPPAMLRAAFRNMAAGSTREGGSTITQQLARMLYLSPERTLKRKVQEAALALWLERKLSKDEILARYLNTAYFGANVYGADAAAKRYFGKSAKALSLAEAAMLAGLVRSPSALTPIRNLDGARARADLVLDAMVETGAITRAQADEARRQPATLRVPPDSPPGTNYFVDMVNADARRLAGSSAAADLTVRSTLDLNLQNAAENVVARMLKAEGRVKRVEQAALVAMAPDGAILAMVGGRDYNESQFNRAIQARRQPGSLFKVFVYLTAFQKGFNPEMTMVDRPVAIGDWEPENYSGRFRGEVTLRSAFANSINSVAVQLADAVGIKNVIDTAHGLGVQSELPAVPSLALGAGDVTLLEMTRAFAAIASNTESVEPYAVRSIQNRGQILFARQKPQLQPASNPAARAAIRDVLTAVVREGTGKAARVNTPAAGKTGTSQEYRNAWFVGFTGDIVVGVWVGNDDNKPMRSVTGGDLPARIWHDFVTQAARTTVARAQPTTIGTGGAPATAAAAAPAAPPPAAASAAPAAPGPNAIRGMAFVLDTATLEVQGRLVRLYGVEGARGRAAREFQRYLGRREVVCEPVGNGTEHRCRVDDQDLSRVVLFNGGGRATANAPPELKAIEQPARSARIGEGSEGAEDYYRYGERGYYPPGRYRTWNGCQPGWTVQDGLCKPYRGY